VKPKNTSIISPDNRDSSVGRIDEAVRHLLRVRETARMLENKLAMLRISVVKSAGASGPDQQQALRDLRVFERESLHARNVFDLACEETTLATTWLSSKEGH